MILNDTDAVYLEQMISIVRLRLRDIERDPFISTAIILHMARNASRIGGVPELERLRAYMNGAIDDEIKVCMAARMSALNPTLDVPAARA